MEVAVSAVTGELFSRFVSFIIKRHTNRACPEEKLERLQHLLLRIHTVVKEAEGRYITNAGMLAQLNMLVNGMYRGYCLLDTIKYRPREEITGCERMHRTPYDSYLYIDNFMFGRTVEKQQIVNFLLQDVSPTGAPAVLPIIGGYAVGKKTGWACLP
ncbi:hypothetical protein ACQ4PT_044447 [Festuca glaucescens]